MYVRWGPPWPRILVPLILLGIAAEPVDGLTLAEAQIRVLEAHPEVEADQWAIEAALALADQARRRPNPVLSLEVEDLRWHDVDSASRERSFSISPGGIGGSFGEAKSQSNGGGLENAEWTLSLEQALETGGKRARRGFLADAETNVARAQQAVTEFNLLSETALAYAEVLGAQEAIALMEAALERLIPLHDAVTKGVDVGKYPPMDSLQSRQIVDQVVLALDDARADLSRARQSLASLWGSRTPDFDSAAGVFPAFAALDLSPDLAETAILHPLYKQWEGELAECEAAYALARAERLPDLTLSLGLRTFASPDERERGWALGNGELGRSDRRSDSDREYSVLLGISVPLPLFNRNRGNIRAAEYRLRSVESRRAAVLRRLEGQITTLAVEVQGGLAGLDRVSRELIPRSHAIMEATQAGYAQGRFNAFDYMQTLQEELTLERDLLDRQVGLYQKVVELERLTGRPLSGLSSVKKPDSADTAGEERTSS